MGQVVKKEFFSGNSKYKPTKGILSLTFKPVQEDLVYVRKNIRIAQRAIAYTVARVMAYVAVDLLAQALPRTPWDTGQLRESGEATLSYRGFDIIGRGSKQGIVQADYGKVSVNKAGAANRIYSHVYFTRKNEKGEDIAYITHELLYPFEVRDRMRPAATKEGTGPKYLELPFRENQARYTRIIRDAYKRKTIDVIRGISQAVKLGQKTEVSRIKLIEGKIKRMGYWG